MKHFFTIGVLLLAVIFLSANAGPPTAIYKEGGNYGVSQYGLIVVLPDTPSGKYNIQPDNEKWKIDYDFNVMFVESKEKDPGELNLIITNNLFPEKEYFLKLSKATGDNYFGKLLIEKLSDLASRSIEKKIDLKQQYTEIKKVLSVAEADTKIPSKPVPEMKVKNIHISGPPEVNPHVEEKSVPVKKIPENINKSEHRFSLSGGMFDVSDNSKFTIQGEWTSAFKIKKGVFLQGSALVESNHYFKKYGFSVGAGLEPGNIGGFVFVDSILYGLDEYDTTFHSQVRIAGRYTKDNIQLIAWAGIPFTTDQYTGVNVVESGETLGIFNKALVHGGVQAKFFFNDIYGELKALIAGDSVYSLTAKVGYFFFKNILVNVEYTKASTGDYDFIEGVNNYSSLRISGNVYFGSKDAVSGKISRKLILDPSFPILVQTKKTPPEGEEAKVDPEIVLTADPLSGPAPLSVSYYASHKGFQGDVEMTWYFTNTYNSTSNNKDSAFTYTVPGTYKCYVTGKDNFGNTATSNTVEITVTDTALEEDEYSITSSVKEGSGTISPEGVTVVKSGENQKYDITPADGWHVNSVYCDGKNIGAVTSYEFKKCDENHIIEAIFSEAPPSTYTLTATSGGNGSVDPNSTEATAGSDVTFTITPDDGYEIDTITDNGSVVSANNGEYTVQNIQETHDIQVTFKLKSYTVTGTVRNSQYGTIDPVSTTVEHGSSITINFTPEDDNKQTIRYWVNGSVVNNEGATSITINNVTSNQNVEVEFDWIYYDVRVRLFFADNKVTGSIDPGEGTYTYKKGTALTFNFSPGANSKVERVLVNGNDKGRIETLKYNITRDDNIDVYMERRSVPITVELNATGCACDITSSIGQSGVGTYTVLWGDSITFWFDPNPGNTNDYYLGVWDGGFSAGALPPSYRFDNVTEDGKRRSVHVKCAEPGDPIPF